MGLLIPFRRDRKRDFASGAGVGMLRSKVEQALMTEGATPRSAGELPWRTNFGAGLASLRHRRNDATLQEIARVYARDALRRWVPTVEITSLQVESEGERLILRLRVRERWTEVEAAAEVML